ncbi:CoA-binding domain-containing protein [Candidatus Magnetoovum chiemensis]|nr:CoA-binding domain-containing protein [Candidatus Magnetoovum chiemensis]
MDDVLLKEIFTTYRNIAVYGMSKNPVKPANMVPSFLYSKGYNIIPINPAADSILGKKPYPNLLEVEENIDLVEVFRRSKDALDVVKQAIERKRTRGDIKAIWLQSGIINEEGRELAQNEGIRFVQDRCMYTEYLRLME